MSDLDIAVLIGSLAGIVVLLVVTGLMALMKSAGEADDQDEKGRKRK